MFNPKDIYPGEMINMEMRWYSWMEGFAVITFIVWIINNSLTDYSAGILIYNGFLPEFFVLLFPLIFTFLSLVYIGALIESTFGGNPKVKSSEVK